MKIDNRSVKEKIKDLKKQCPDAKRAYLFYVIEDNSADMFSGAKIYLDGCIFETHLNESHIIELVRRKFDFILMRSVVYKPEEIHCERYSLTNGFCEEYLLLNNGAYERSGLKEDMKFHEPATEHEEVDYEKLFSKEFIKEVDDLIEKRRKRDKEISVIPFPEDYDCDIIVVPKKHTKHIAWMIQMMINTKEIYPELEFIPYEPIPVSDINERTNFQNRYGNISKKLDNGK